MARRNHFWKHFAIGAGAGSAATIAVLYGLQFLGRAGYRRIVRLEKSIQIGSPVEDVFRAWIDLERLPQLTDVIEHVIREGDRSHWKVNIDGKQIEWNAVIEQFILNQAIGWKSTSGAKHSGRITFSPLGTDTMVHVTMNYAPKLWLLTPFAASVSERIEEIIEKVLRDVKSALELKTEKQTSLAQGTGTYGPAAELAGATQHTRFGGTPNPVEFTRPPEIKS